MQRDALSPMLDGGYVREYSLDLLEKSFIMQVDVLDAGRLSSYEVCFLGISALEFRDEAVNRWERIEVTEVRVDESPESSSSEEWAVWINLWDAAQLTVRCATIRVDGEVLT
jgi:hypothetical protein